MQPERHTRRVTFSPDTKEFNRVPGTFGWTRRGYSHDIILRRIAVERLIHKLDERIPILENSLQRASSPEQRTMYQRDLRQAIEQRSDLMRTFHILYHSYRRM